MNSIKNIFKAVLAVSVLFMASACQDETITPTRGLLYPSANMTTIFVGQTISFADYSTRVASRAWTFEGGSPSSSAESAVEVSYAEAGTYTARLDVTYIDGTTETETISISVNNEYVPLVTIDGPTYVFYSEDPELTQDHPRFSLSRSGLGLARYTASAFEGEEAINFTIDPDATSTFAMLQTQNVGTADLTEFRNGYLNLAMRST